MQVRPLSWDDPLEEEMATHSSIRAWRMPWTEYPGGYGPWGHKKSDMTAVLSTDSNRAYCRVVAVVSTLVKLLGRHFQLDVP